LGAIACSSFAKLHLFFVFPQIALDLFMSPHRNTPRMRDVSVHSRDNLDGQECGAVIVLVARLDARVSLLLFASFSYSSGVGHIPIVTSMAV
jgi:hypothetical protein